MSVGFRGIFRGIGAALGVFLALRYLLPLVSPFLTGAAVALAAEPMVSFFAVRCRLGRTLGAGLGVVLTLALLALAAVFLGGLVIRELGNLAGILPELEGGVRSGMGELSRWLLAMADRTPEGIRGILSQTVTDLFSGGSALLDRGVDFLLHLASGILSRVPGGALRAFTAILSAFMISGKLETIRGWLRGRLPAQKLKPVLQGLGKVKDAALGWLKAQAKLSGVTFLVALTGLLLLKIPHAPLWAAVVALVDVFPVLGTGTVLLPWSLISFLQGDTGRAFFLLGIYGAAAVTRTVLEPRLVGKQLGLDPLVTLMALYMGYRLFGLPGMLLSPMIAVVVTQTATAEKPTEKRDA